MGYRFLGCPVSFCSGFNISLLIEQPSSLLYNNGNFDPGSYVYTDTLTDGLITEGWRALVLWRPFDASKTECQAAEPMISGIHAQKQQAVLKV